MKKIVSLLLVLCFCVGLAACGKSSAASASPSASSASPSAASAPASSPAPTAEPKAEPTPVPFSIQELVDALNAEELAQRTEEDPYIAVFEVAAEANTINYKLAMDYFQYVISTAIGGEAEFIDAYNRILTSIPPIENSLESMIHETQPDINIVLQLVGEVSPPAPLNAGFPASHLSIPDDGKDSRSAPQIISVHIQRIFRS